jgi:small subunit ribosomal protein S20
MANTKQAKKRARQADAHRNRNAAQRSMLRSAIKRVVRAIAAKDKAGAEAAYKAAVPVIDSMTRKGHIHKNKAARHKSRMNESIRAL